MQFVVFGANESLLPLLRAASANGHRCIATTGLGRWAAAVDSLTPGAIHDAPWELFIDQSPTELTLGGEMRRVDAVVLSLDHAASVEERDLRAEQLRKLAAAGMAVLAVLPVCEGIVGYELDMIRRDTGVVLYPYSPLAAHQGAARIADLVAGRDPSLGEIDQLVVERCADVETDAERLELFAQDAHLLDGLLGGLKEVTASSSKPETLEQLAAHVEGRYTVARWNLVRGAPTRLKLSVLGTQGRVEWQVTDAPGEAFADQFGNGQWTSADGEVTTLNDDSARGAWSRFAEALGPKDAESQAMVMKMPWDGGCRAAEAADYVPRSVRRGRAVAMQNQTPTEEDTFKGMMAAGSCGMLMMVLLIFVVWGVIESVRLPAQRARFLREREAAEVAGQPLPPLAPTSFWLRIWPVYPLAFLLALQLFRLAFPASTPPRPALPRQPKTEDDEPEPSSLD